MYILYTSSISYLFKYKIRQHERRIANGNNNEEVVKWILSHGWPQQHDDNQDVRGNSEEAQREIHVTGEGSHHLGVGAKHLNTKKNLQLLPSLSYYQHFIQQINVISENEKCSDLFSVQDCFNSCMCYR